MSSFRKRARIPDKRKLEEQLEKEFAELTKRRSVLNETKKPPLVAAQPTVGQPTARPSSTLTLSNAPPGLPRNVLLDKHERSPASDLARPSQSPRTQQASNSGRGRLLFADDSSDDDNQFSFDDVRQLMKANGISSKASKPEEKQPATAPTTGVGFLDDDDSLSDDHAPLQPIKREKEQLSSEDDNLQSPSNGRKPTVARNPLALMKAEATSPSVRSPLMARTVAEDKDRKPSPVVARNPLALMKAEASSPPVQSPPISRAAADELWDDDMNEVVVPVRAKAKKQTNPTKSSPTKRSRSKSTRSSDDDDDEPCGAKRRADYSEMVVDEDIDVDEWKPYFVEPRFGPFALEPHFLGTDAGGASYQIPPSMARYLLEYQVAGVQFMFDNISSKGRGAILGDDMGLGKTVQVVVLIAALLHKTGKGADLHEVLRRKKYVETRLWEINCDNAKSLRETGRLLEPVDISEEVGRQRWAPILLLVPPSVVEQWKRDFGTWGYFALSVYASGSGQEAALEMVRTGQSEVMICTHSMFQNRATLDSLKDIPWKLIVVDEFHLFRNMNNITAKSLRELSLHLQDLEMECHVVGLTGTIMPNTHKELWNQVDLASPHYLGSWKAFESQYANPIKRGMQSSADDLTVQIKEQKKMELYAMLDQVFIQRTKEGVLGDVLPDKQVYLVFCELSDLQKRIYQHLLQLPDFEYLRTATGPCDCGVNQKFFEEYQRLSSKEQRIEYQRTHKNEIVKRGNCCYRAPHNGASPDGIEPDAILWRHLHEDNDLMPCNKCPHCLGLPAQTILAKASNHLALLQAKTHPDSCPEGSKAHSAARKALEKAQVFLPDYALQYLPGRGLIRQDSLLDDHFELSGKLRVLSALLGRIQEEGGRVLLFSQWVETLDLIENYVRTSGYSFLRMDGTTDTKKRQALADKFQANSEYFLFLLSTNAMGVGLNLTSASVCILYDPNWNPSNDDQAQDRLFRIGQEEDVTVYRLVSRGTLDEQKYLRQVYKTDLKKETVQEKDGQVRGPVEGRFRGVAGDQQQKGELFGTVNLMKYKDGTFLNYGKSSASFKLSGATVYSSRDVDGTVQGMSEDQAYRFFNGDDLSLPPGGGAPLSSTSGQDHETGVDSDSDDDLGGESQINMYICERHREPSRNPTALDKVDEGTHAEGDSSTVQAENKDSPADHEERDRPTAQAGKNDSSAVHSAKTKLSVPIPVARKLVDPAKSVFSAFEKPKSKKKNRRKD